MAKDSQGKGGSRVVQPEIALTPVLSHLVTVLQGWEPKLKFAWKGLLCSSPFSALILGSFSP